MRCYTQLADCPAFPHAQPFTSMLSLDVEKELGVRFDKARMHGEWTTGVAVRSADEQSYTA